MPTPIYLSKLVGETQGDITGSVTQAGREGHMLVNKFSHDVVIPRDTQSGLPTGKRVHYPMIVTKEIDIATPKLFQALTSGEHFSTVEFMFWRINSAGKEENYYTITLENAIIVSIQTYIHDCLDKHWEGHTHLEDVSFTYQKIRWTHVIEAIESEDDWEAPRV